MDSWTRRDTDTFLRYFRETVTTLEEIKKLLEKSVKNEGNQSDEEKEDKGE